MSRKKLIGIVTACIIVVIVVLVISLSGRGPARGPVASFPDPNLETAIREAITICEGPIYPSDLDSLTYLDASVKNIADLTGLECCTSLASLSLWGNQISDISPLADLTSLTDLLLWYNQISDISPLVDNEGLSEWDIVNLSGNPLSSDSINIYIPQLEARGVNVNY